jgi:hypothetical protein
VDAGLPEKSSSARHQAFGRAGESFEFGDPESAHQVLNRCTRVE